MPIFCRRVQLVPLPRDPTSRGSQHSHRRRRVVFDGVRLPADFAVFENPVKIGSTAGKGSFVWDGAAGTWFWIDPTNDLVFVGMLQRMMTGPGLPKVEDLSRTLVYQVLVDRKK